MLPGRKQEYPTGVSRSLAVAVVVALLGALLGVIGTRPVRAGTNVWTTHGPTTGGTIYDIAIDPVHPEVVYAGGTEYQGQGVPVVYKSTDRGETWTMAVLIPGDTPNRRGSGGVGLWVVALAIDPSNPATIYAAVNARRGVFKSTDGGTSWERVGSPPTDLSLRDLAIDPVRPQTLYAATSGEVYKSTDGGRTWTPTGPKAQVVLVDPADSDTVYATGTGVYKSTDGGASWTLIGQFAGSVFTAAIDPSDTSTLYVGSETVDGRSDLHGVYKSTDGGMSWMPMDSGFPEGYKLRVYALAVDPARPDTVYAGTFNSGEPLDVPGVFKTTDGGASWNAVNSGLPQGFFGDQVQFNDLAVDPLDTDTLYAGLCCQVGGVYRSTNGAATWTAANQGFVPDGSPLSLAIDPSSPDNVYAGTRDPLTIYRSRTGGNSWQLAAAGIEFNQARVWSLVIDPVTPSTIYAAIGTGTSGGIYNPNGVWKSVDGARTWTRSSSGLPKSSGAFSQFPQVFALAIDPLSPNTLYAATSRSIFKTTDGGASWNRMDNGVHCPDLVVVSQCAITIALAIDPSSPSTVYAGTIAGVYKTTDGGATWRFSGPGTPVGVGFSNSSASVESLAIDPTNPATVYAGTEDHGVLKTTDGGGTWATTGLTSPVGPLVLDPSDPDTLYAGSPRGWLDRRCEDIRDDWKGVSVTGDGGATWATLNNGLPKWGPNSDCPGMFMLVLSLAVAPDGSRIYAGVFQVGVNEMTLSGPDATPSPTQTPTVPPSPLPTATGGASPAPTPSPTGPTGHRGTYPLVPSDPYFGAPSTGPTDYRPNQWGPKKIQAPQAWQEPRATGSGIRVAVLDSGVDLEHEDLQCPGKLMVVPGSDLVGDGNSVDDGNGHGTHVAGIIGACTNNGKGVAGVAPDATIMPFQVITRQGVGSLDTAGVGVKAAADAGAHVINLSLGAIIGSAGGLRQPVKVLTAMDEAISYARSKGVVVVAAAGNDSGPLCGYPAAVEGVLCVGATDPRDLKSYYSTFPVKLEGSGLGGAVVAPGGTGHVFCDAHSEDILSTYPAELDRCNEGLAGYRSLDGTSMAAPHVAGVAALVYDRLGGERSAANATRVIDAITKNADDLGAPGYDPLFGWGRVNALKSVRAIPAGATPSPSPTGSATPTGSGSPSPSESPQPGVSDVSFTGDSAQSGQYSDETLFKARLVDSNGDPLGGRELAFELAGAESSRSFNATTDEDGVARVSPTLEEKPGTYQLTVRYDGDQNQAGDADTMSFVVDKEDSALELTETKGKDKALVARLSDADTPTTGIAGRTIDFYAGAGLIGSATTGDDGVATFTPPKQKGKPQPHEARFGGDDLYLGSSAQEKGKGGNGAGGAGGGAEQTYAGKMLLM